MTFKNHVGRPSNEELRKKRNIKILIVILPIIVLLVLTFYITGGNFSNLMGNSVTNYYCIEDAKYQDNKCEREVKEQVYYVGDIDKNGSITIEDATKLQMYLQKNYFFDEQQKILADCNGDGDINSEDVSLIQQYVADISMGQRIEVSSYSLVKNKKACGISYNLEGNYCIKKIYTEPLVKDKYSDVRYAYYLGDINKDDIVDGKDYSYLSDYLSNSSSYPLNNDQLFLSDLNSDTKVDTKDLSLLKNYLIDNNIDTDVGKKRVCQNDYTLNNNYCVYEKRDVFATNIILNKQEEKLAVGKSTKIIATIEPSNVTNKTVTYESSDTSVATVTNYGVVTAKKIGQATIIAKTVNNKKAIYKLTVISEVDEYCD